MVVRLHSALPMKETSKEKMLAFFLSSRRPLERYFCLTKISYHTKDNPAGVIFCMVNSGVEKNHAVVRFRKEMSEKKTCFLFRSSAAKEAFALAKADLHSALPGRYINIIRIYPNLRQFPGKHQKSQVHFS